MKEMNDPLRNLHEATEKLSKLNWTNQNPWSALHQVQDIFNHEFWNNLGQLSSYATPAPHDGETESTPPVSKRNTAHLPVDIFQTLSKVIVCCEIPGLDRNSLKLSISQGSLLSIKGKIKGHDLSEYQVSKERNYGSFQRKIQLPVPVMASGVQTVYKDGLLEVQFSRQSGDVGDNSWNVTCDL